MENKVIAIVGLPGSGKSEVINFLTEKHGWPKVYFGDVTFDEMGKRGLEINEKNERIVREDLRAKYGKDHYAKKVIEKINHLAADSPILVESLYSWQEYQMFVNEYGNRFLIIAVYASPKTRYKRLGNRPVRPLTAEEARGRDYAQIENLTQANAIAMADYTLVNESSLEDLHRHIENILSDF